MTDQDNNQYDPDEYDTIEVSEDVEIEETLDEGKRRFLLILQLLLIGIIAIVVFFGIRYFVSPAPISQMLPTFNIATIPPAYKFAFDVEKPSGIAVSPDNQRVYVVETGGDRLIKMFDRDGNLITSFAPPYTDVSTRAMTYVAVSPTGFVYVVDSYNDVISIFDADGNYIDGIISKDRTLSKLVLENTGLAPQPGTIFMFDILSHSVVYQEPGKPKQTIPGANLKLWSPIAARFDKDGNLLVTNLTAGVHEVLLFPAKDLQGNLNEFTPIVLNFGVEGNGPGELSFPNSVVRDSKGNFYVSDGNNGRISVWTPDGQYSTFFGMGSTNETINLSRGLWMDANDHLHIADAVGQTIRVYDVSGTEPVFLFNIGDFGIDEGLFRSPTDVLIDGTGRMYVADRNNSRVQVWSY
jgi:DNA-binding beta-propeller fold protein YncE